VKHKKDAEALFSGGFNCAQAVLAAYGVELGLDRDTALKLASPLGEGIARMGQVCGAVTGALMVIGLRFGAANSWNKIQNARVQKRAEQFLKKFKKIHGSVNCCDLLGRDLSTAEGRKEAKREKVFETICVKHVRDASEILDKMV
jgi:C_GCAxxG_C_C family probable redox protein